MSELAHKDVWLTKHEGIPIEICRHDAIDYTKNQASPLWTYYIYVHEQSVPKNRLSAVFLKGKWGCAGEGCPSRMTYHYARYGVFHTLDWHHGITHYEIQQGELRGRRIAKAGCSYDHLWDEGKHHIYSVEGVLDEAKRTVDCLLEAIPNLKRRCSWTGRWSRKDEGTVNGHGSFTSFPGKEAESAFLAKAKG